MKKIFIFLIFIFVNINTYGIELKKNNFTVNIYSSLYADMFYGNHKPSNFSDNISHTFKSYAFTGSSNIGIGMDFHNISFNFEAGIDDAVRKYNMTYYFNKEDKHYILIGRDTTMAAYSFGQVANDLAGLNDYGTLADNRRLQVRYGIKNFHAALVVPYVHQWNKEYVNDYGGNIKGYIFIPRIELAYDYESEKVDIKAFAGYGYFAYKNEGRETGIHSALAGIGSYSKIDDKSSIYLSSFYGFNANMTNSLSKNKSILMVNNKLVTEDIHSFGISAGFQYKYSKLITAQAGIGYTFDYANNYQSIDDALGAYINMVIKINDFFSITPEISFFDSMQTKDEQSEGYDFMAGVLAAFAL